jgi:hypothetical protein
MVFSRTRLGAIIVLGLGVTGCVAPAARALPGRTTAGPQLERDTLAMVLGLDRASDADCGVREVASRSVTAAGPPGASEDGVLDRCGTLVRYAITYTPAPGGGTTLGVHPGQVVGRSAAAAAAALPREFRNVWYRPGDRGFSLRAFAASGPLSVSDTRIVFGEPGETIAIDVRDVKSIGLRKMAGDTENDWAVVRYGEPERVAGFKDGTALGWGTDTKAIYWTLQRALEERRGRPGR